MSNKSYITKPKNSRIEVGSEEKTNLLWEKIYRKPILIIKIKKNESNRD